MGAPVGDQLRQPVQGLRSEDDIDVRRAGDDGLALLAGHAAADTDDEVGVLLLEVLHPAQVVEDLLLRLLAHRAGVEEDHVRLFGVVGFLEAIGRPEHIRHLVRVILVHLATESTDIKFFHCMLTKSVQAHIIAGFGR